MQKNLIRLMHHPRISYISGGHLFKAETYIQVILDFLKKLA